MKEVLFGWITKPTIMLTAIDKIMATIEIFGALFILLYATMFICIIVNKIKEKIKEKNK